jgi:hypothetical protein
MLAYYKFNLYSFNRISAFNSALFCLLLLNICFFVSVIKNREKDKYFLFYIVQILLISIIVFLSADLLLKLNLFPVEEIKKIISVIQIFHITVSIFPLIRNIIAKNKPDSTNNVNKSALSLSLSLSLLEQHYIFL